MINRIAVLEIGERPAALFGALLLLALLAPRAAEAKIGCLYDSATKTLTVAAANSDEAGIRRSGSGFGTRSSRI
jgi:hypothetical protein